MPTLLILLSVVCSASAHFAFKYAVVGIDGAARPAGGIGFAIAALGNPYIWAGLVLHSTALVTWLFALRRADISYAYPFISLGFVLVLALSVALLGERVGAMRLIGVALIIGGVFCVART